MMVKAAPLHVDSFGSWLADLPLVTLAELNHAAALQTRVDRKYLIGQADLDAFLTSGAEIRALDIDGQTSLEYWSTYFDTEQLHSFLGAARRRPNRFKVRVRTYVDSGLTFLEVKTRSRRGQTVKSRIPTRVSSHDQLSDHDCHFVVTTLIDRFGRSPLATATPELELELETVVADLQATLTTEYQRTTLLVSDNSRVTIDQGLRVTSNNGTSRRLVDHVVVETKSSRSPSPIDRLLWDQGHRPATFSKYGTGLVLLHPKLPGSKWNRVLRQQLGWLPADPGVQPIHGQLSVNSQQLNGVLKSDHRATGDHHGRRTPTYR